MAKPAYVLAFCGHRNLPSNHQLTKAISEALEAYRTEAEKIGGELHLHCMIAYGADLIAVEQAQALKIPVHLILPKEPFAVPEGSPIVGLAEDYHDPVTGEFLVDDWARTVKALDRSRTGLDGGTLRIFNNGSTSSECFHDTAVKMLSVADGLLTVWDGLPAKGPGGCGETCEYAKASGIPIWRLKPDSDHGDVKQAPSPLLATGASEIALTLLKDYEEGAGSFLAKLDQQAEATGENFRGRTNKNLSLHFYATLLAALGACFVTYAAAKTALIMLAVVQGVLVTLAWWNQRKISRSNAHVRWVNFRFAAELTRSVVATGGIADPMYPNIGNHLQQWTRFSRTLALTSHRKAKEENWQARRGRYIQERLRGQISYFASKKKAADKESAALRQLFVMATQLAPWVAAAGITYKVAEKAGVSLQDYAIMLGLAKLPFAESARLLPIALPLIAGYIGARRQTSDAERRRTRYAYLADHLRRAEANLELLRTETSVRTAVERVEEILLTEQVEWLMKENPAQR